jgi:hypothetical protein
VRDLRHFENVYANFDLFLASFFPAKSIALTDKAGKQLVLTSQNLENHTKLLEGRHKYGRHLKRRRLPVKRTLSDFIDTGSQEEPAEANEVAADEAEEVASEANDGNVSDDTYGFGSLGGSDRDESDGEGSDYDWFGLGNDDGEDDGSDFDLFGSDNEADAERRTGGTKKTKESGGQKTGKKNKPTDGDDEDGWFDW